MIFLLWCRALSVLVAAGWRYSGMQDGRGRHGRLDSSYHQQ